MSAADVIGILSFILHVTHKVYDAVQEVRKAPEEIKTLQNEARHVRELLERFGLRPRSEEQSGDDASQSELRHLVELSGRGGELIAAANKFIEKATKLGDDGARKVKKTRWLFKGSEAKELTEDFKTFHRALTDICSINTYTTLRAMQHRMSAMGDLTVSTLEERMTWMERLLAVHEERITGILNHSLATVSQQQREGLHHVFDELSALRGDLVHGHSAKHLSLTNNNHRESRAPLDGEPRTARVTTGSVPETSLISRASYQVDGETYLPSWYPGFGPPEQRCPLDCQCRCHKHSSTYHLIPRALRSWLGDICVHERLLASLVSSARSCDDARCIQTRENLSVIKWYLPSLFGRVYAEIEFQSLPIHFVIQTPRVVKSMDTLYNISFEQLKVKLSTREITVNDIQPTGRSMLHMAFMVVMGRDQAYEMMRYLVEAGAPRDWEFAGLTVTEFVIEDSTRWLGNGVSAASALESFKYNIAKPLLGDDMEDSWERIRAKRRWNDLHCLLANPTSSSTQLESDLNRILALSSAALHLNAKDRFGRTPLEQAIRSYPEAVDTLLRAGANPHLVATSLADAVVAASSSAIGPLVRAGANVSQRSHKFEGHISTALHGVIRGWPYLGPCRRLQAALELMRHAGHLLNWRIEDEAGRTALDWADLLTMIFPDDEEAAAVYELYRTRELPPNTQLIDTSCLDKRSGAVADLKSTSLIEAGLAGDIEAVGALIDAGAMVNERDNADRTLLHLVGMGLVPNGYAVALEVVRHGGYGVDWRARTLEGSTVKGLIKETLRRIPASDMKQRKEAENILALFRRRALPPGEEYIYPCMHPEFCWLCSARPCSGYCSNGLRMPGQW